MDWLSSADEAAPNLPAVWLIRTLERPANRPERSALRQRTARSVLARMLGLPATEIALAHDAAGRPFVARPAGTGLHISLATRGGVVAVALARAPIGVDVEAVDLTSEPPLAALHPDERALIAALAPGERAITFARLWAAKEAYVKALGTGFVRPPESFAVRLESTGSFRVDDAGRRHLARGYIRTHENGGHGTMAAAVIQL